MTEALAQLRQAVGGRSAGTETTPVLLPWLLRGDSSWSRRHLLALGRCLTSSARRARAGSPWDPATSASSPPARRPWRRSSEHISVSSLVNITSPWIGGLELEQIYEQQWSFLLVLFTYIGDCGRLVVKAKILGFFYDMHMLELHRKCAIVLVHGFGGGVFS